MKLCVIGAGGAGLISIKHAVEFDCEVIAFELTNKVGGLWNYTDQIGKDKYGVDIHSSMYQGLVTNLPIEIMSYAGHPFPEQEKSFVSSEEVLKYYQSFAEKFGLKKYIKFKHQVVRVRPVGDEWEVIVKHLPTDVYSTYIFDAVLVCNGHFSSGYIPKIEGQNDFQGKQFHSHDYRCAEWLKDLKVLVIGGSYSGSDIVQESSKFAKQVMWSHHMEPKPVTWFRENVKQKPDVKMLTKTGAQFTDDSLSDVDVIFYCTGYCYKFPFLSVDCGVSTLDNHVSPLYMHCLSINKPSLGFIGLPNLIAPNPLFDLQSRFCLTFMTGRKKLPSKEDMLKDYELDMQTQEKRGFSGSKSHYLGGDSLYNYYADMAARADVEPVKSHISKIHTQAILNSKVDFLNFRKVKFNVEEYY